MSQVVCSAEWDDVPDTVDSCGCNIRAEEGSDEISIRLVAILYIIVNLAV